MIVIGPDERSYGLSAQFDDMFSDPGLLGERQLQVAAMTARHTPQSLPWLCGAKGRDAHSEHIFGYFSDCDGISMRGGTSYVRNK